MGDPKECPACRLLSPPDAQRCDCGYDYAARRHVGSLLPTDPNVPRDAGSLLLLGSLLAAAGAFLGAAVGVPVRVWTAGPGPDGCGLWVLPVVLEGVTCGAVLGGLAGAAAAAWLLRHRA